MSQQQRLVLTGSDVAVPIQVPVLPLFGVFAAVFKVELVRLVAYVLQVPVSVTTQQHDSPETIRSSPFFLLFVGTAVPWLLAQCSLPAEAHDRDGGCGSGMGEKMDGACGCQQRLLGAEAADGSDITALFPEAAAVRRNLPLARNLSWKVTSSCVATLLQI